MDFTSVSFMAVFAVIVCAYHLTTPRLRWLVLLLGGYLLCLLSNPLHLLVLLSVSLFAFGVALLIDRGPSQAARRRWLLGGIVTMAGSLAAFRHCPWIGRALAKGASGVGLPWWENPVAVLVPLGISFYSLKVISYLVDVYRRSAPAERHLGYLAVYIGLLPELPSGPIDRPGALLPQLRSPSRLNVAQVSSGVQLFVWGLAKKVVVADRLRPFVDYGYTNSATVDGFSLVVATLFFAFQVYWDFSAYTDMALGLGDTLGLTLARNFDRPYGARSVAEFWSRWHITFSSWLRDYLFLPLAYALGRRLEGRRLLGLDEDKLAYGGSALITMLVGGLWHGVNTGYVAWGLFIAACLSISIWTRKPRASLGRRVFGVRFKRQRAAARVVFTFFLLNVSWVFFRAGSAGEGLSILASWPLGIAQYGLRAIGALSSGGRGAGLLGPFLLGQTPFDLILVVCGLAVLGMADSRQAHRGPGPGIGGKTGNHRWIAFVLLVVAILAFGASNRQDFVYAGF